jgi:hypothetical protein
MSFLQITEYATIAQNGLLREPALATQTIPIGSESVISKPFQKDTRIVRLYTDEHCSVRFGSAPLQATEADTRLMAGSVTSIGVNEGLSVAAIGVPSDTSALNTISGLLVLQNNPAAAQQWLDNFTQKKAEADKRIAAAANREKEINEALVTLTKREATLQDNLAMLNQRAVAADTRTKDQDQWGIRLKDKEKQLNDLAVELAARSKAVEEKAQEHLRQAQGRDNEFQMRVKLVEAELAQRSAVLDKREKTIKARESELEAARDAAKAAEASHLGAVERMKSALAGDSQP